MVKKYLKLIEKEIRKQKFGSNPQSLYEPIRYIMGIGGKRLRPLLTLLAYSLYKKEATEIVPYAVAVEVFHNFTLMHDDIMDQATVRRGHATVHEKWNTSTAILAGDVMLVKVYELFLGLPENKRLSVLKAFSRCAAEVCEGQQYDMEFEDRWDVTEQEYIEMIRLKTAVLLGFSLELGALLADAPEEDRQRLRIFGTYMGIGFQLKDDLLDVYGDPEKFGKQTGGDIVANKKTMLTIKTLEQVTNYQRKSFLKWMKTERYNPLKKISVIKEYYEKFQVRQITENIMNDYFNRAFEQLEGLSEKKRVNPLRRFTQNLIDRQR